MKQANIDNRKETIQTRQFDLKMHRKHQNQDSTSISKKLFPSEAKSRLESARKSRRLNLFHAGRSLSKRTIGGESRLELARQKRKKTQREFNESEKKLVQEKVDQLMEDLKLFRNPSLEGSVIS